MLYFRYKQLPKVILKKGVIIMQAIKAYYDDGKFVPIQPIRLPKGSSAVITIFDFPIVEAKPTMDESRVEWLNRLREARELAKDEDLPERKQFTTSLFSNVP